MTDPEGNAADPRRAVAAVALGAVPDVPPAALAAGLHAADRGVADDPHGRRPDLGRDLDTATPGSRSPTRPGRWPWSRSTRSTGPYEGSGNVNGWGCRHPAGLLADLRSHPQRSRRQRPGVLRGRADPGTALRRATPGGSDWISVNGEPGGILLLPRRRAARSSAARSTAGSGPTPCCTTRVLVRHPAGGVEGRHRAVLAGRPSRRRATRGGDLGLVLRPVPGRRACPVRTSRSPFRACLAEVGLPPRRSGTFPPPKWDFSAVGVGVVAIEMAPDPCSATCRRRELPLGRP